MVGPLGLEPRTKGFTLPRRFRQEWTISPPSSLLQQEKLGRGTLKPVIKGTQALR